MAKKVNTVGD